MSPTVTPILPAVHLFSSDEEKFDSMNIPNSTNTDIGKKTAGTSVVNALSLLLHEDPFLVEHGLTSYRGNSHDSPLRNNDDDGVVDCDEEDPVYTYASNLLNTNSSVIPTSSSSGWMSSSSSEEYRQRATVALADVDRKLALVESMVQRISRDDPETIAGPFLKLHGFDLPAKISEDETHVEVLSKMASNNENPDSSSSVMTINTIRDKVSRLHRQSQLLATTAIRVESTLQRGVTRMESATTRLSRVLELSATLKMILRLQFEAKKISSDGSLLDLESIKSGGSIGGVDLRDLTRAAASIAVMEELLAHPAITPTDGSAAIDVVEKIRPGAKEVAGFVRQAAAGLMNDLQNQNSSSDLTASLSRLGATLQVYFHLGELHDATWKAVSSALGPAEKANSQLFHPTAIQKMKEMAQAEARALADVEARNDGKDDPSSIISSSNPGLPKAMDPRQRKKQNEAVYERLFQRKLREKRALAASKWADAIADASSRVWNLHRVLVRRNDPVTRKNFLEVVAEKGVPKEFEKADVWLQRFHRMRIEGEQSRNNGGSGESSVNKAKFSVFSLFWIQICLGLGSRIKRLLSHDGGSIEGEVAALYPAIRASSLEMVTELYDVLQMALLSLDDYSTGSFASIGGGAAADIGWATAGVMGGSAGLEDSVFFGTDSVLEDNLVTKADEAAGGFFVRSSADSWTHVDANVFLQGTSAARRSGVGLKSGGSSSLVNSSSTITIFSSVEWIALHGGRTDDKIDFVKNGNTPMGLGLLGSVFLKESRKRLFAPLEFMFPEAVAVDEDGVALPVLPTLPSRYDLAKLDAIIREELSLADPRQGGGEMSMISMIGEMVVKMLQEFCSAARRSICETVDDRVLDPRTGSASEAVKHNLKVANVMSTLASFVKNAPDNTFIIPFQPASSPQHEEASHACSIALLPALQGIENLVRKSILDPLCHALNQKIATATAKMHRGSYNLESTNIQSTSFVQIYLTDHFDTIAATYLSQLPSEYAAIVASTIATFSMYSFVSNAALIRPLGETSRLRLTQDLADFELVLEQFVFKGSTTTSLSQVANGKPYCELRALRQLLYWNLLDDKTLSPAEIAKALLREVWVKDIRPSTLFHFLFSFAPTILSSPHHYKRMEAGEYVGMLIKLDGSIDDGEASAWMTCMACCDAYQQRESLDLNVTDGDRRISAILMIIGPELLRRRRQ